MREDALEYIRRSCQEIFQKTMRETVAQAKEDVRKEVKSAKHQRNARGISKAGIWQL